MNIVNDLTPDHIAYWSDGRPILMKAPPDTTDVSDCMAIISHNEIHVAWKPDEIDLAHLAKGGTLWLTCIEGLPPHYLCVQPPT